LCTPAKMNNGAVIWSNNAALTRTTLNSLSFWTRLVDRQRACRIENTLVVQVQGCARFLPGSHAQRAAYTNAVAGRNHSYAYKLLPAGCHPEDSTPTGFLCAGQSYQHTKAARGNADP
jgi:hypothetical protein